MLQSEFKTSINELHSQFEKVTKLDWARKEKAMEEQATVGDVKRANLEYISEDGRLTEELEKLFNGLGFSKETAQQVHLIEILKRVSDLKAIHTLD